MNLHALLEKLGLHPYEASIYLAALELGEATVSELAHKTETPRTSVQEVVVNMQKKGLLSSYTRQTHKYWVAEDPNKLLKALQENQAALQTAMPELQGLRIKNDQRPQVKVYSGVKEIKNIMDDILDTQHHISALISWDDWIEFFGDEYVSDFIKRRYTKFLKIKILTPRTKLADRLKVKDGQELRHTRFLPENISLKRISNFIYGDKIAIISMNKKEPKGVLIDDADVVYANTLYFENLWQHSSDK